MASTSSLFTDDNEFNSVIEKIFDADSTDCEFHLFNETNEIEKVRGHRKLLSSLSEVFRAMFNESWYNAQVIEIEDATAAAFKAFLRYFYHGAAEITSENVGEILYLGHKYLVNAITTKSIKYLIDHLSPENVIEAMTLAGRFDHANLRSECDQFIRLNIDKVLRSDNFFQCGVENLVEILNVQPVKCREVVIFDACIDWAKICCLQKGIDAEQVKNLRTELGPCFSLIRFTKMHRKEFAERYERYKAMFTREEIDSILVELLKMDGNTQDEDDEMDVSIDSDATIQKSIEFKFEPTGYTQEPSSTIKFQLSKPLLLTAISFSRVYIHGTESMIPMDFTANITIKRSYQTIASFSRMFPRNIPTTNDNVKLLLPQKVFIDDDSRHTISLSLVGENRTYSEAYQYTYDDDRINGVSIFFHSSSSELESNIFSSLEFEACGDDQLTSHLKTLPLIGK